ncbi:chondroitinase-B domain-containing protein [Colwellia sp. E2M01]|uniref:chondroitinase-B domain-containing protein n=1 Tax=Colwellia sp. E2M01 TaxID=2841561 RepID=UPI001C08E980|nr:chondroitinase-B domain-containing protein [Colwellia sp. E2M01]MBU2871048.1 VCBS domain-containing protein [Colwellia sp. E2M01]
MKNNLITLALAVALSACGSDGSDNNEGNDGGNNSDGGTTVNTPAVISGTSTASISTSSTETSNNVSVTDVDAGEAEFVTQTDADTTYGIFSITATGGWSYSLDTANASVIALTDPSDTLTDTIAIESADGTPSTIVITITGVASTSTESNASFYSGRDAELSSTTNGTYSQNFYMNDDDAGEEGVQSQTNVATTYGTFSIATDDGDHTWEYTLDNDNAAVQALTEGSDPLVDIIPILSIDGTESEVTITITGPVTVDTTMLEGGDTVPTISCTQTVSSILALEDATDDLEAGDTLCLEDGNYTGPLELRIEGIGTKEAPITVAAQTASGVVISGGESSIRMGGEYIIVQGFVLRDGQSGSSIIKFEQEEVCNYCRITEVSLIDMDGGDFGSSKWVEFEGHHNRVDHSYFSGKESRGALMVFGRWTSEEDFNANGYPAEYSLIDHNYFGNRAPAWGRGYAGSSDNEYEGIRLGLSTTHSAPSYTTVENNYFERIQGEAEIISNKSANNVIRNNTIRDSNGSIVTRHGEGADISNNFIFGDDNPFAGGIRLVDGEHTVTNNYIEGARFQNSNWNGGIVLTTGDGSGDTENGYQNVENVLVANNTIVDSVNSLNVAGGRENQAPSGVYLVNNIVADAIGPVIRTNDENMPSGTYDGNYVYGQSLSDDGATTVPGFSLVDAMLEKGSDGLYRPGSSSPSLVAAVVDTGDFDLPNIDMDGQARSTSTTSGADETSADTIALQPLTAADVGPTVKPAPGKIYVQRVEIANHDFDSGDLTGWINNGGSIVTTATASDDVFSRGNSLKIDSNAGDVKQTVTVTANTNYTLSAFMKGTAKLAVEVDGQVYAAERDSDSYGFSSVTFNSGNASSATITAMVDNFIANEATIENARFDSKQSSWTVVEGSGIGQVQDSDNSSTSTNGSIKFTYNTGDTGTPHDPYIAQTVTVVPNTDYTLSMYQLLKSSHTGSNIEFGVFTEDSTTPLADASIIQEKLSVYSELVSAGANELDDDFLQDTLSFNTGSNTSVTIFAQYQTSTGDEIRVDDFQLSYDGAPVDGTEAFFDSIRLVSHPLSEAESVASGG